jgi:murein L,D-transpeptidase YafK
MRRSTFRAMTLVAALALPLVTSGCQSFSGLLAALFGGPPPSGPPAEVALPAPMADLIVVHKHQRTLQLLHDGTVFATFPIALGPQPRGPKQREGDGRTPEGLYHVDWRSMDTRYTRELHISYPDKRDREHAKAMHVNPGGEIFIHGMPRDYGPVDPPRWYRDWTEGCIAVGNAAIVKIWDEVPDGTPIDILP